MRSRYRWPPTRAPTLANSASVRSPRKKPCGRIYTWNNEENPHMLAINIALGFAPAGGCANFQGPL